MTKSLLLAFTFLISVFMNAQENSETALPYETIPEYPETYTAGSVVSRLIDGLGFRYYWATEGLRTKDLTYKPSDEGRTTAETIDHLYGLSRVIYNSAIKKANDRTSSTKEELSFEEKRAKTLQHFKMASEIFLKLEDLSEHKVIFKNPNRTSEFPFWNQINGPIADALWHCGQVVLLRRASGNPFNSAVSVFQGKKRDR